MIRGIKIVFKYLRPYRRRLVILGLAGLVAAAADAFVPLLAGRIFDGIIAIAGNKNAVLTTLVNLLLLWLAVRLASDLFNWIVDRGRDRVSAVLRADYQARGFAKLLELPMAFHKRRKHGEVTDRLIRAANSLERFVNSILINLGPQFLSIVIALIIAFTINVRLAFVLIAALAVYILILWRSSPRLTLLYKRMEKAYNRAWGRGFDALNNVQEVKQATTEKFEERRLLDSFVNKAADLWFRLTVIWQRLDYSQRILITFTQLAIFAYSVVLIREGAITPGELVAFNGYAAMFFGPFVILGNNWHVIQGGLVSILRAEEVLQSPTEIYVPGNAVIVSEFKGEVEFQKVSFGYTKEQKILKNISFHARPGEVIALVGESGVGKTTIVDLLLGFYFPEKGKILIDGHDVRELDLLNYRRAVAVVPQEVTLFNDTVKFNIAYGNPGASDKKIKKAAELAHAAEFIEKFPKQYKQLVGWRGIKLSTGQKQRIAIARAILRNPKVLILDEPTSALDAESERYIKESFRDLMRGKTTFIVAHRLSTIKEADRILVFDKGELVESGRHEELVKKGGGVYRKLYELQIGFY